MNRVNHSLLMLELDRSLADSLRPMFVKDVGEFRSRLPSQLQVLGDQVLELFNAFAAADTAKMIEIYTELDKTSSAGSDAKRTIAEMQVFSGRYRDALANLEPYLKEGGSAGSGFFYPYCLYLSGIANEGIGKTAEAIKLYREALGYWANPEIEIPAIKDMKARLSRLKA